MYEIFCKYIKKLKNKNVCLQPENKYKHYGFCT